MKLLKFYISSTLLILSVLVMDAARVTFKVQGLVDSHGATVSLGSAEWLETMDVSTDGEFHFDGVPEGLHAMKITAPGYYVPESKLVKVNSDGSVDPVVGIQLVVTPMSDNPDEWIHEWHQDDSVEGYTQTSHVNTRPEVEFLGKKTVPSDVPYMAVLLENYEILLSDENSAWTQEYAYRLVETLKTLCADAFRNGKLTKFLLTDQRLTDDITFEKFDDGDVLTISKEAFAYANPFLVNLDGVRGRFFSKRLHHALAKFVTDFGSNEGIVDHILRERFGVSVNVSDYSALTATGEDENHFQKFGPSELVAIINMFEELPEGFHKTENLKYLLRRLDGHPHPWYEDAAAVAWCKEDGYIEFMNSNKGSAFHGTNENFDTQRLILHEKTHFLWAYTFSEELKSDWIEVGGWYRDPNANPDEPDAGWSTTKTTEFVSQYAHDKNPNEDMAESVAFYLKDPEKLMSRAPEKYDFIRDRVMHGTRYISSIPDHLTFEVLNLYPDYDYPGKIKRVAIKVDGAQDEDKIITMEIELNHEEGFEDDAANAWVRITSPVFKDQFGNKKSQFVDIWMMPVDGNGHLLRGQASVNKYSKAGYWTCGSIVVSDNVGNQRFEGRNDCVTNVYINNPLEDLECPVYKSGTLEYELTEGTDEGHDVQLLKVSYEVSDNVGIRHSFVRIDNDCQGWSKGGTGLTDCYGGYNDSTGKAELTYTIPEFYPSANYFVTFLESCDLAGTEQLVMFGEAEDQEPVKKIAITTPNPDYEGPEIDLNRITVFAEPTHPENPDGETLVTIHFYARDNISGCGPMMYYFRDPQGLIHGNYWFYHRNSSGRYFDGDPTVWEHYQISHILPQGSAPGIWGLSEFTLMDKAGNERTYNFVETLIFEPDDSEDGWDLFADIENSNLFFTLNSNEGGGYGYTWRVIHEQTGQEISGEYNSPGTRSSGQVEVDLSDMPAGDIILITTVKDASGEYLTVKSKRMNYSGASIPPTAIALNQSEVSLNIGETIQLTATITPEDATDKSVVWTSSNPEVATVTDGLVKAIRRGEATITATTTNGLTATCSVTVIQPVESVTISQSNATLSVGETLQLTANINPENANDQSITWDSSDIRYVTVSETGLVTAVMTGEANITATASNGVSASCKVTVRTVDPESISLDMTALTIDAGDSQTLHATITPADATNQELTWTTSDPGVATVEDGVVTGVAGGACTVKATTVNGLEAVCEVTVREKATGIELSETELNLEVGDTHQLTVTFYPETTTERHITWVTSDASVATVEDGLVTVVGVGTARIKATYALGISATCVVNATADVDVLLADGATCDVYTVTGILVLRDATRHDIERLTPDVYILRRGDTVVKLHLP